MRRETERKRLREIERGRERSSLERKREKEGRKAGSLATISRHSASERPHGRREALALARRTFEMTEIMRKQLTVILHI